MLFQADATATIEQLMLIPGTARDGNRGGTPLSGGIDGKKNLLDSGKDSRIGTRSDHGCCYDSRTVLFHAVANL